MTRGCFPETGDPVVSVGRVAFMFPFQQGQKISSVKRDVARAIGRLKLNLTSLLCHPHPSPPPSFLSSCILLSFGPFITLRRCRESRFRVHRLEKPPSSCRRDFSPGQTRQTTPYLSSSSTRPCHLPAVPASEYNLPPRGAKAFRGGIVRFLRATLFPIGFRSARRRETDPPFSFQR